MDRIPATPLLSLQPWPRPRHAALGPLVGTDGREGPGPTASAAAGTGGNESLPEEVAYPFTASCSPSYVSPQPSPTRSQGHLQRLPAFTSALRLSESQDFFLASYSWNSDTNSGGGSSLFVLYRSTEEDKVLAAKLINLGKTQSTNMISEAAK